MPVSSRPDVDPTVRALADLEGLERSVAGNTPFWLDDPSRVWLVLQGRVEVFCVNVVDGEPDGARYHYLTAEPGDALFGIDQSRYGQGLGLLAVGAVGTRVREISLAQLQARPEPPVGLVDTWIAGLSRGVSRTIVPQPRADATLADGSDVRVRAGGRARAGKGVVWVKHVVGSSLFVGMEELEAGGPDVLFPLTTDSFLQTLEPARLVAVDTRTALESGDGWRGLDAFYGPLFRCEFFNTRLSAADELNRLKDKAERDRRDREGALTGLAAVLARESAEFVDITSDDPLLASCAVVARRLGMKVQPPPRAKDGEASLDPLGDILRASRIRTRRVVLKDRWWTEETGPLVARIEQSQHPVALLPSRRPGRIELHDPVTRTTRVVTEELARTLAPQAYTLYRSLPDTARAPLALFRFAMRGAGSDLARPVALGVIGGMLAMVTPFFMGRLVDDVIPQADRGQLWQLALIIGVVAITTASFNIVRQLSVLRLETKASVSVQPALWDHLLGLPVAFFRRYTAGDLTQRALAADAMRRVLSGATMSSLMTSVFSIFMLAQLFYYSRQLAVWATGLAAIAMLFIVVVGVLQLRLQRPTTEITGRISGLVLQLLTGIAKLRVAGAEARAFSVWAREFAQLKRLSLKSATIESWVETYNSVFPVVSSMLLFYLVLSVSMNPAPGSPPLTAGQFIAFNTAFGAFLMQMLELGKAGVSVLSIVPQFERARPVLEARRETDATKTDAGELSGRIEIERVCFRYHPDGPLVLDDVTIAVEPGQFIALVGPSGSGKSTLARLLLGLDVPESGSVYYDGRDLAQLDVQKLRRRIGVVMQAGKIRPGSLLENIIGSAPLTLQDAWEAARQAGLDEDIKQMPMGMMTAMQQGGPTLSGGQRQRLMIARAIVDRPRVLIFDEATSALDNRTQAIVTGSLERLQATRIVIAHRLSTIAGADRIYVLQAGRIIQAGTYEELAAQPGLFADLIKRQVA